MKLLIVDRYSYSVSQREITPEGFMKVPGRVARTGIQEYLAGELGLDGDPNRIVRVYRPPEEVFSDASLSSYNGVDITDDHPAELVNSENFKRVTVGNVLGAGSQDGDFVVAPMVIKDKAAIEKIDAGKAELSAGYTAEYVQENGQTEDGISYEFIQRDIRINHVALVDKARAGAMARIFDKKPEATMAKITLDNGRAIEVEDAVAAQVEDCIQRLTDKAKAETDRADGLQAQLDSTTEELTSAKKLASNDAISARVVAVASTMDAARKLAGEDFTCDSVDAVEIKRAAMAVAKDSIDWADKSAAYVEAAFDLEMERKEEDEDEDQEGKKAAQDAQARLAADLATQDKDKQSPHTKFVDGMSNAWKQTIGEDA